MTGGFVGACADPAEIVPVLAAALGDDSPEVPIVGAAALVRYGLAGTAAEPQLLRAAAAWALAADHRLAHLVAALRAVSPDPRGRV